MPSLAHFLTWKPLRVGSPATGLSLTADDGTWIKLPDFKGHLHVVLVFFASTEAAATEAYLRQVDAARARFETLETAVFGVNTARTDTLRAYRGRIGIEFFLLYDPFAMAARGYRASGRIRPFCRDQTVIIAKDGTVIFDERGFPDVERLLTCVAAVDGRDVPPPPTPVAHAESNLRTPGNMPAVVVDVDCQHAIALLDEADSPFLLVDVRTKSEFEQDRSPRARHIPVDELPHRYAELGQNTHLLFVCHSGGRSAAAAEFMTSIGASQVFNVVGGMSSWSGPRTSGPV